jgi:cell division protein ZapA
MESGAGKSTVRVTIFGQTYVLRAPADPHQVEQLAAEVDRLMETIAARAGDLDPSRVAVLACLHLADRLRSVEQELSGLRRRIEEKTQQLSLLLE